VIGEIRVAGPRSALSGEESRAVAAQIETLRAAD
jgi:hypothetical protein